MFAQADLGFGQQMHYFFDTLELTLVCVGLAGVMRLLTQPERICTVIMIAVMVER